MDLTRQSLLVKQADEFDAPITAYIKTVLNLTRKSLLVKSADEFYASVPACKSSDWI
jgi:hypothetical protein